MPFSLFVLKLLSTIPATCVSFEIRTAKADGKCKYVVA